METGVPGVNGLNVQNSVMEETDRETENVTAQLLLIMVKAVKVLINKKNSATLTHVLVGVQHSNEHKLLGYFCLKHKKIVIYLKYKIILLRKLELTEGLKVCRTSNY